MGHTCNPMSHTCRTQTVMMVGNAARTIYPIVANLARIYHKTKMHVTHITHKISGMHVKTGTNMFFFNVISESQPHHLLLEVSSQKWSPYTKQGTTSDGHGGVHHTDQWQSH